MPLLDIVLGYDCNLACTYCTITDEMRRRSAPVDRIAAAIDRASARGIRDIAFTGGEPTIFRELPGLVRYAKRRGFEHVKVASNGLRYADAAYLERILEVGVDRFHVSMHAFKDDAYDAVVRRPGAAELRRRAVAELVRRDLDPVADLILKEDTYRDLRAWVRDLRAAGVRRFALWLVSLTDKNAPNVEQLPALRVMVPELMATFDEARAGGYEVVSLHVPRCLLPGYEGHIRHPGGDDVLVVTPDDTFDLRGSRLSGGIKPAACARCIHEPECPGLRSDYVATHGDAEVAPVEKRP